MSTGSRIIRRIEAALDKWDILNHPWNEWLLAGKLPPESMQGYAISVYQENTRVVRAMYGLAFNCPDRRVRGGLAQNLAGEESGVSGVPSHGELAMRFALATGAKRKEVENAPVLPEHAANIAAIRELALTRPWLEGLTAIAIGRERHYSPMCAAVARGLRQHYGFSARDVEYFSCHVEGPGSDEEHEALGRQILKEYATPNMEDRLVAIALEGAFGHWLWHDGLFREYVLKVPTPGDVCRMAAANMVSSGAKQKSKSARANS